MPDAAALDTECRALARYLTGAPPSDYVLGCYRRAATTPAAAPPIDRALLAAARAAPWLARTADAYARLARPTGLLRRRLTLVFAILENAPETHRGLNEGETGPRAAVVGRLAWQLGLSGLALVAGALGFGPLHLVTLPFSRRSTRPSEPA